MLHSKDTLKKIIDFSIPC